VAKLEKPIGALMAAMVLLSSCARGNNPENPPTALFSPEMAASGRDYDGQVGGVAPGADSGEQCPAAGAAGYIAPRSPGERSTPSEHMRYSRGDRFNVMVPGLTDFSGDYAINADGMVILPFAGEFRAVGLTNAELSSRIQAAFIRAKLFKGEGARVAVRPVQYAPINISVSGAVFVPGRAAINTSTGDTGGGPKSPEKWGDAPLDRLIPSAMRAAGGVTPDADVSGITLIRDGRRYRLDWRGAFTGERVDDVPLIDGDKIVVPHGPCFQSGLVRPSQITPPGIRIFQSNLTVPATSNASSSIGQYSGSLPYGTRFLQALASANCIGGTMSTNANRQAILVSRNPRTMRTEVTQRSIEELVRSADRDAVNPFIMPDDAIACYDSTITEFKDVMTTLTATFTAGTTFRTLSGF